MPRFVFTANDIDIPGVSVDAALPVEWVEHELGDAEIHGAAPGHVSARLSRSGTEIVVRGRVRVRVSLPCARCLQPAPVDVDTELSLLLKPVPSAHRAVSAARPPGVGTARKRKAEPDEEPAAKPARARKDLDYEFSSGEADVDTFDGEEVVLDGFLREAILLEMPNFPLCSEACPGIGPAATPPDPAEGATLIDPRLAPLGALRDKLKVALGGQAAAPKASPKASKKVRLTSSLTKPPKKKSRKKE